MNTHKLNICKYYYNTSMVQRNKFHLQGMLNEDSNFLPAAHNNNNRHQHHRHHYHHHPELTKSTDLSTLGFLTNINVQNKKVDCKNIHRHTYRLLPTDTHCMRYTRAKY